MFEWRLGDCQDPGFVNLASAKFQPRLAVASTTSASRVSRAIAINNRQQSPPTSSEQEMATI